MITKIIITQKKGKMPNGTPRMDVSIEIKQSPAGGDICRMDATKLLVGALQTILDHPLAKKQG